MMAFITDEPKAASAIQTKPRATAPAGSLNKPTRAKRPPRHRSSVDTPHPPNPPPTPVLLAQARLRASRRGGDRRKSRGKRKAGSHGEPASSIDQGGTFGTYASPLPADVIHITFPAERLPAAGAAVRAASASGRLPFVKPAVGQDASWHVEAIEVPQNLEVCYSETRTKPRLG